MPFSEGEKPKFIPIEERLSDELRERIVGLFQPIADEISGILKKKIIVKFFIKEPWKNEVPQVARSTVHFVEEESGTAVASIDWLVKEDAKSTAMQAGMLFVGDKINGHDIGYKMLCAKKAVGKLLGYSKMLLNDLGSGYPQQIVTRETEKESNWVELPKGDPLAYAGKTFIGDIK